MYIYILPAWLVQAFCQAFTATIAIWDQYPTQLYSDRQSHLPLLSSVCKKGLVEVDLCTAKKKNTSAVLSGFDQFPKS